MNKETNQSEELTISKATTRNLVLAALYGLSVSLASKLILNRWFSWPVANGLAVSTLGCVYSLLLAHYAPRPLSRLRIVAGLVFMIFMGGLIYLTDKLLFGGAYGN